MNGVALLLPEMRSLRNYNYLEITGIIDLIFFIYDEIFVFSVLGKLKYQIPNSVFWRYNEANVIYALEVKR